MENNIYFKNRDGKEYTKYTKDEINEKINPFEPKTFIPFLQELDFPYFEEDWARLLAANYEKPVPNKNIFGKYLSKMKLASFKRLRFSDSIYHKDLYRFAFQPYGWGHTFSGDYHIIQHNELKSFYKNEKSTEEKYKEIIVFLLDELECHHLGIKDFYFHAIKNKYNIDF